MGYCWASIEQETELDSIDDKSIEDFKTKHSDIVELFEGEFLKKSSNGKILILGNESFSLDSRYFPTLDDGKPNLNRARVKFFEGAKMSILPSDEPGFGWGQKGLSKEFYTDLARLINEEVSFYVDEVDNGDSGYYSGTFYLYLDNDNTVFNGSFSYYQGEDEEDEEDEEDLNDIDDISKEKVQEAITNSNNDMEEAAKYLGLKLEDFSVLAKKYKLFKSNVIEDSAFQEEVDEVREIVKRIVAENINYSDWIDFIKKNGFENVDSRIGVIEINRDNFIFRICNKSLPEVPDKINFAEGHLVGWLVKD